MKKGKGVWPLERGTRLGPKECIGLQTDETTVF